MREIRDYLSDIKTECEYLIERTKDLSYENFIQNEELKRAFVRSLEIIGEASKQIPREIRKKYPQIRWKSVVGMRNLLIHEYFGVDYRVVWKVIKERLPKLYEIINQIISEI
ncbi:MAG: DUF86 domain-containing protein [Bacteroidota bacterium]